MPTEIFLNPLIVVEALIGAPECKTTCRPMFRGCVILLATLLSVTTVSAASLDVTLTRSGDYRVAGEVEVNAAMGGLDLAAIGGEFSLSWESASGYHVTREMEFIGRGNYSSGTGTKDPTNTTIAWGPGALTGVRPTDDLPAKLFLFADASGPANLRAQGPFQGSLSTMATEEIFYSAVNGSGAKNAFWYQVPSGSVHVSGIPQHGATLIRDAHFSATGNLGLLVRGLSLTVQTDAGEDRLTTGSFEEDRYAATDVSIGWVERNSFAVLHFENASFSSRSPAIRFLAPDVTVSASGSIKVDSAFGEVRYGFQRLILEDEPLVVNGFAGDLQFARTTPLLILPGSGTYRPGDIDGDADEVFVDGRPIYPISVSPNSVGVTAATLSFAALAVIVWKYGATWFPFYTRLTRAALLNHPARQRLYDLIAAEPGLKRAELARKAEITELVARHHLRKLEAHGFIVLRNNGRATSYLVASQPADSPLVTLNRALQGKTRRRIAGHLASSARPLTQLEIESATGISQRLVSYHLSQLDASGLLEISGSHPKLYAAAALLSEHFAVGEETPGRVG